MVLLLNKLPNWAYGVAAFVGGSALALVMILNYGAGRYQAGRDSITQGVRVDTVTINVIRRADSTAKASTDAVVKRTKATAQRVDTLVLRVPDSLLVVPEISELVRTTYTLTAQVDTLTRTLDVERAVSRLRASTDSAALVSASIVIGAQVDEIRTLKQRPQWQTVGWAALTAGVLGFVGGVLK